MQQLGGLYLAVAATALLIAAGCVNPSHPSVAGASASQTPITEPTRDPGKDGLPLVAEIHVGASAHTFQGGDDHVGIVIDNRGRDLQDLVVMAPGLGR